MASKKEVQPSWREQLARAGSYRDVFSFDPARIKHPSAGWVAMFRDEFGMTDSDFRTPVSQGDDAVSLDGRPGIDPAHRAAMEKIVGEDNVDDSDYARVRFGHGKTVDENLALRAGHVGSVPDLVVHPRDKDDVAAIVTYCVEHTIPVIPYGAGSGTVLGTRADSGGVVLVMRTHMNQLLFSRASSVPTSRLCSTRRRLASGRIARSRAGTSRSRSRWPRSEAGSLRWAPGRHPPTTAMRTTSW